MGAAFDENQSSVSFLLGEQNTAEVPGKDRVYLRAGGRLAAKRFERFGKAFVCKINCVRNEEGSLAVLRVALLGNSLFHPRKQNQR